MSLYVGRYAISILFLGSKYFLRNFKHQSAVYITQTASTIPAAPTGVSTAEKRRKQPMQTLIMDRSVVESEFQNCVVVGGMSVVPSHREHFWHFV